MSETTPRGFQIFGRVPCASGGTVRVQESSMAFEGAHVWLFLDGEECKEHLGKHSRPAPHLDVAQAKQLIAALSDFVVAAEQGALMEPAEVEDNRARAGGR